MTHRVYSYIIALIGVMFFISCSNVDNPAANDDGQAQNVTSGQDNLCMKSI